LYTGGTVFHTFLSEMPDPESVKLFIRRAFERYPIPYLTITPTFSVCPNHGYLSGKVFACPHCGEETEVYSRVVGYYRPVERWNRGKQEEFKTRKEYALR
ncbi:MAG: ribonucleoside triphosphate reductase, partial [Atribacterota bacterium]|nr:ribonucleoside triphosphate reductase [Atribacterota bacterium]